MHLERGGQSEVLARVVNADLAALLLGAANAVRPVYIAAGSQPGEQGERRTSRVDPLAHARLVVQLQHVDHVCAVAVRVQEQRLVRTEVDDVIDLERLVVGCGGKQHAVRAGGKALNGACVA